jgi:hypothetical protein
MPATNRLNHGTFLYETGMENTFLSNLLRRMLENKKQFLKHASAKFRAP